MCLPALRVEVKDRKSTMQNWAEAGQVSVPLADGFNRDVVEGDLNYFFLCEITTGNPRHLSSLHGESRMDGHGSHIEQCPGSTLNHVSPH